MNNKTAINLNQCVLKAIGKQQQERKTIKKIAYFHKGTTLWELHFTRQFIMCMYLLLDFGFGF